MRSLPHDNHHTPGQQRGWAIYLVLGFAAFPLADLRRLLLGGTAIWLWAAAITYRMIKHPHTTNQPYAPVSPH